MKNNIVLSLIGATFVLASASAPAEKMVLSDSKFFKELGVPVLQKHPRLDLAVADLSSVSEERLHQVAHALKRCGGYEDLHSTSQEVLNWNIERELGALESKMILDRKSAQRFQAEGGAQTMTVVKRPELEALLSQVSAENLKTWVTWMQDFGTRYHAASEPNRPVIQLEAKIKEILANSKLQYRVEQISHTRTKQKSVKVTFPGTVEPDKKIILGAHFDSIAGWGGWGDAPGADDNASGSSNLLEVIRLVSQTKQPRRTIEFFWYAAEEAGLVGSKQIAQSYNDGGQRVLAVMQLDMTLFPGDGPFVLGSVTDFTTPWVREFLKSINQAYFGFKMNEFECGYGCSDHASWYRQGYSTVAPFEARMDSMNRDIHSDRDRVSASSNFEHSAAFSKLALAFALELDQTDNEFTR